MSYDILRVVIIDDPAPGGRLVYKKEKKLATEDTKETKIKELPEDTIQLNTTTTTTTGVDEPATPGSSSEVSAPENYGSGVSASDLPAVDRSDGSDMPEGSYTKNPHETLGTNSDWGVAPQKSRPINNEGPPAEG